MQRRLMAELLDGRFADGDVAGYVVSERWESALVGAGAECWRLSVGPEGLRTVLADAVALGDQDLELESFNRAFEVRADDRKFANDFLDARMIEFLERNAAGCVLETVGNRIMVARPAGRLPDVESLLTLAFGVAERVPSVVKDLSPPSPAGELTPRCRLGPDGLVRDLPRQRGRSQVRPVARRARQMGVTRACCIGVG